MLEDICLMKISFDSSRERSVAILPSVFQQSSFPLVILLKNLEAQGPYTSHAHIV